MPGIQGPGPGGDGSGAGRKKPKKIYGNPLRGIRGLTPERIDMGVDYSGSGPIYPIGPAVVTEVDQAWKGGFGDVGPGTFIKYRITEGPLRGRLWYVAEHVQPSVQVGQQVSAGTQLGTVSGGIETGFAGQAPGTTMAQQAGQVPRSGDLGEFSTGWGQAASLVLQATGAPPGVKGIVTTSSGPIPPWLAGALEEIQRITGVPVGDVAGGINRAVSGAEEIGHWAGVLVANITDIHMWISLGWLLLGALLVFWGILLWLRIPQRAAEVAPAAAAAAA